MRGRSAAADQRKDRASGATGWQGGHGGAILTGQNHGRKIGGAAAELAQFRWGKNKNHGARCDGAALIAPDRMMPARRRRSIGGRADCRPSHSKGGEQFGAAAVRIKAPGQASGTGRGAKFGHGAGVDRRGGGAVDAIGGGP